MEDKKTSTGRDLTPEKLRTYKGFENSTDEETEKQIDDIKTLVRILFRLYEKESSEIQD